MAALFDCLLLRAAVAPIYIYNIYVDSIYFFHSLVFCIMYGSLIATRAVSVFEKGEILLLLFRLSGEKQQGLAIVAS